MTNRFDVAGCVVIITGGAGLLGREYGRALSEAGARVVLADLDPSVVADVAADVATAGPVLGLSADVTSEASVGALVARTLTEFGQIDGLVNNAAINPQFGADRTAHTTRFEDFPMDPWNQALAVNLTGMFLCARAVVPYMRARQHGSIVNISSTYGLVGPDQRLYETVDGTPQEFKPVTYSVTKSGVLGLTRYLATYLAGTGIRVNTLTPGGVFTSQSPEFVRRYSERTTLNRMARPHEYSGALQFLLSDASSYMTGSNLIVDGGWTAW